jgi:hypothetical protein
VQQRKGVRRFPTTTAIQLARTPKKAKPSAAARPAERSGEGRFGGLPRLRQSNSLARRRRPSRAQQPGRTQRRKGARGFPPTRQPNTQARRRRPSRAQRPGLCAVEKGGSGVSPDYGNPTRSHAKKSQAERSGHVERSREREGPGSPPITTQHSTPIRRRQPSAAARSSTVEKGGSGVSPRLRQSNSPARRRWPSRAQRRRGV